MPGGEIVKMFRGDPMQVPSSGTGIRRLDDTQQTAVPKGGSGIKDIGCAETEKIKKPKPKVQKPEDGKKFERTDLSPDAKEAAKEEKHEKANTYPVSTKSRRIAGDDHNSLSL